MLLAERPVGGRGLFLCRFSSNKHEHFNLLGNGTQEDSLCLVILILPARGTSRERSHTNKHEHTHERVRIYWSEIKPVKFSLVDGGNVAPQFDFFSEYFNANQQFC